MDAVLEDIAIGAYVVEAPTRQDFLRAREILSRYAVGLTDALVAALAERNGRTVVTFDRRHFTKLRTASGKPFVLRP